MQAQTDGARLRLRVQACIWNVVSAGALAAFGVIAGFVSLFVANPVYGMVEAEWRLFGQLMGDYVVQPGFGVVAVAYVWRRDDYRPLDRIQTPSLEGMAWIALGALGYELVVVPAVTPLLPAIGLHHGSHPGTATWRVLVEHPSLVLPGLIVMFAVMAPMEELLYRGVIHDILDPVLGPLGRVLAGAFLFGVMHVFLSGSVVSLLFTSLFGAILGAGYERTENLTVPIIVHASHWLLAPL